MHVRGHAGRPRRVFLLSPARMGGARSAMLLREGADFDLAIRLRQGIATVGELYAFVSGLYFRGKMSYANSFGFPPAGLPEAVVIVPGFGLIPAATVLTRTQLEAIAQVPVEEANDEFRSPLIRDATRLEELAGPACHFVLLGSVATKKYTQPLLEVFGERLLFPKDFVGRGDMSRGGLMLRSASSGDELAYIPVLGANHKGKRPPKLERLRKSRE